MQDVASADTLYAQRCALLVAPDLFRVDEAIQARREIEAARVATDAQRKRRRAWRRAALLGLGVAALVFFGGLVAAAAG